MYAKVIMHKNGKLYLIMDGAGIKPLYWYKKNGLFLFSSEIKSFHQHPNFHKQICKAGLTLYFQYGYIPQPHNRITLFYSVWSMG
jgi:asparagine synthase (glutamine-hydrolysing)